jgi:hypothetical protein
MTISFFFMECFYIQRWTETVVQRIESYASASKKDDHTVPVLSPPPITGWAPGRPLSKGLFIFR